MSAAKKKSVKESNLRKEPSTIHRHSAPTLYDLLPHGTSIVVAEKELYIQTSQNENSPCWVLMGPWLPSPAF
jgi:hypothetical protein